MLQKVRHIAIVFGLLLCITLSFAWMTELDSEEGRFLYLQYDKSLYSAATEMEAELYLLETQIVDGEEVLVYSDPQPTYETNPNALISSENFAPGDYRLYALKLKNKTNAPMTVSVNLAKLQGDELFWDYMNVGVSGSVGFNNDYPAPAIEEFAMAERATANGDVNFIRLLELPPTADANANDNFVEIRFYIRFSHTAVNELQDKSFKIGVVNVLAT